LLIRSLTHGTYKEHRSHKTAVDALAVECMQHSPIR